MLNLLWDLGKKRQRYKEFNCREQLSTRKAGVRKGIL
jgi:hypothetical protein